MDRREPSKWPERLQQGETFETWFEFKEFIVDHGVQTERILITVKKDRRRMIVECKMNNAGLENRCPVRIRAIEKKKTGTITIMKINMKHECEAADHWKRRMHTCSDRLATQIFDIVMRNRQTRACSLRDTAQAFIHPDIRYHTAWSAKKRALQRLDGNEKDSFYLIPDHCRHILDRDPGATAKWAAPDGKFASLFVTPSAARQALKHCRPLVAFDGTHTKSTYPQILLIATALDANNQVVMLAYCMVPTENPTEWLRFLRLIRDAIPELDKPGMVFISDREKGLLAGVEGVFPRAFHCYCTWHLGDNCRTTFGKNAQKDFEPLVYATTPEQYKRRFERIKRKNAQLADYIQRIANPKHYSRAYCPVKRWGHETSQQAESVNRAIKAQRQEVALKQSQLLWDYMMAKYFQKARIAETLTTPYLPNIMKAMKETEEKSTLLIADPSSETECRVTDSLGRQFLVQFDPECICSCGDPQDTGLPCVHVWRACTKLCKRHFDYISDFYKTSAYKATYSKSIPAVLQEDLVPNENCGEPAIRRGRGRPSEKRRLRFEPEDPVRRLRKCSVCKSTEHDKRRCPAWVAVLAQGRGQGPTVESEDEVDEDEVVNGGDASIALDSDTLEEDISDPEVADAKVTDEESLDEEADWEFCEEARQTRKDLYISDAESEEALGAESEEPLGAGPEEVIEVPIASQPDTQGSTQGGTQTPNAVGQLSGSSGFFSSLLQGVIDNGPTM